MQYAKLSMLELVNQFAKMTKYDKKNFYAAEIVKNPLTHEKFLRIRKRTTGVDRLIIWHYTREEDEVETNRGSRVKEFDFKTHDDECLTVHMLLDMGYRIREVAAFTGYSPATCRRRDNELLTTRSFTATRVKNFKKKQLENFRK